MNWLEANGVAVQAISSVLTFFVTAALVWITWQYVKVTRELAGVAIAAGATRRRELLSHAAHLSNILKDLPGVDDPRLPDAFHRVDDLQDFDFGHFRALAAEVSPETSVYADEVEKYMRCLRDIIREVRSVPPGRGYDWRDFPNRDYDEAWRFAHGALNNLVQQISGIAQARV